MEKKKKIKYVNPLMKFNTGLHKYEPELPLKKVGKKPQLKIGWTWWITIAIVVIVLVGVLFLAKKYGVI